MGVQDALGPLLLTSQVFPSSSLKSPSAIIYPPPESCSVMKAFSPQAFLCRFHFSGTSSVW